MFDVHCTDNCQMFVSYFQVCFYILFLQLAAENVIFLVFDIVYFVCPLAAWIFFLDIMMR